MTLSTSEASSVLGNDSEDDFDWEEVEVPAQPANLEPGPSSTPQKTFEITLEARVRPKDNDPKKKALNAAIHAERVARVNSHKLHTLCLIANGLVRNNWINNPLLHARLMSLTPMWLQDSFSMIHKSRIPEAPQRGRAFENAVSHLAEWWAQEFFEVEMTGHIRSKTFDEVQRSLAAEEFKFDSDWGLISGEDSEEHEIVKSSKSLMKHTLLRRGSRDVSAQLFTALCRALQIPARLVVSLQSVPWKAGVGKPKANGKKKAAPKSKDDETDDDSGDSDMEEVPIPTLSLSNGKGKVLDSQGGFLVEDNPSDEFKPLSDKARGKQKAPPVIRLRKSKPKAQPQNPRLSRAVTPDPALTPPVFWTEVFSRADGRWLPVDPIRNIVNKRGSFDPSTSATGRFRVENRMLYILALEEDGFARDVTARYAKEYGAKVAKMQRGGGTGKSRREWWERVLNVIRRPYRLNRDVVEDEELKSYQITEGMPTFMAGFKDHPLFVLERHLKREEVVHPLVEIGKFRGEPVYPRDHVLALKTAENWTRQGRRVREGCQPMKLVKQRAVTVNRKRAIEMALADQPAGDAQESDGGIMQGLYAENQTELYIPDPIVDGVIPKNDFGNIDLYVPSMLPRGAAFIPHKGAAKIARQFGFDYAEAVTSFEFKNRRAIPVISGIVVASENETAILEAYWQTESIRAEKEEAKRRADVSKRWARLVRGLRIRQRLLDQYKGQGESQPHAVQNNSDAEPESKLEEPGGYLTAVAGVIQHYSLPQNPREIIHRSSPAAEAALDITPDTELDENETEQTHFIPFPEPVSNDDDALPGSRSNGAIKTMEELANEARSKAAEAIELSLRADNYDDDYDVRPIKPTRRGRASASASGQSTPASSMAKTASVNTPSNTKTSRKRGRQDTGQSTGKVSPVKRARMSAAAQDSLIPASDRVLRTRRAKSSAEVEAEKETEMAYRRAVEQY